MYTKEQLNKLGFKEVKDEETGIIDFVKMLSVPRKF